jgi:DNA-directed RNA polymerase specialized sigma24 family protein
VESDREDAESQIAMKLVEYVFTVTPGEEFWECNFAGCFNARTVNILKAFALQRTPAISSSVATASGEEYDLLAELPDAGAEIRFQDIEAEELRVFLSRGNPQVGEFLYLCLTEMSDSEIAQRLGVTDRTLRNWKTKIRADLGRSREE